MGATAAFIAPWPAIAPSLSETNAPPGEHHGGVNCGPNAEGRVYLHLGRLAQSCHQSKARSVRLATQEPGICIVCLTCLAPCPTRDSAGPARRFNHPRFPPLGSLPRSSTVIVVGREAAERVKRFLLSRPDTRRSPPTRIWPAGDARVLGDAQRLGHGRRRRDMPHTAGPAAVR